jgi:hypothetical protein
MLYYPSIMKKYSRRIAMACLGLILATAAAALTHSKAVQSSRPAIDDSTAFFLQTTATPQPKDRSEIGSTDGIVAMGFLIGLIIFIPIAARRRQWKRQSTP